MPLYFFDNLIRRYSTEFDVEVEQDGSWDNGVWKPGEPLRATLEGAIIPVNDRKIYASGGAYTTKDRQLFMTQPLGAQLDKIKVYWSGNVYAAELDMDCQELGGFFVYILKAVSKFDKA